VNAELMPLSSVDLSWPVALTHSKFSIELPMPSKIQLRRVVPGKGCLRDRISE